MPKRATTLYVVDGVVKIYAPHSTTGKGKYYRIVYPFQGGNKDTTVKTLELAKARAGKIARELKHCGNLRFQLSGGEFIDAYLNPVTREVFGVLEVQSTHWLKNLC